MLLSTCFECMCPHACHHVTICYSPHGLYGILLILDIMSPYAILHMVCIAFSLWLISCLHMIFSSWFLRMLLSICYSPHGLHGSLHMLGIMCPYVMLLMICMAFSTCLTSCLHMQLSSWFPSHSPHTLNHVSICYAPHGYHDILHMLCILSPYAMLLMLGMVFSTCLASCLHMQFSSWFAWHSPHA